MEVKLLVVSFFVLKEARRWDSEEQKKYCNLSFLLPGNQTDKQWGIIVIKVIEEIGWRWKMRLYMKVIFSSQLKRNLAFRFPAFLQCTALACVSIQITKLSHQMIDTLLIKNLISGVSFLAYQWVCFFLCFYLMDAHFIWNNLSLLTSTAGFESRVNAPSLTRWFVVPLSSSH